MRDVGTLMKFYSKYHLLPFLGLRSPPFLSRKVVNISDCSFWVFFLVVVIKKSETINVVIVVCIAKSSLCCCSCYCEFFVQTF